MSGWYLVAWKISSVSIVALFTLSYIKGTQLQKLTSTPAAPPSVRRSVNLEDNNVIRAAKSRLLTQMFIYPPLPSLLVGVVMIECGKMATMFVCSCALAVQLLIFQEQ